MANEPYKINWWESSAYNCVRDEIQNQLPSHIRKIKHTKMELDKNERKPMRNLGWESHNMALIETQLKNVQELFNIWESSLSLNGSVYSLLFLLTRLILI